MANSVFIDLLEAMKSLLADPPIPGVLRVDTDLLAPVLAVRQFAINLRLDKSDGQSGGVTGSPTDWSTDIEMELYARAQSGQQPAKVVDPLLVALWERLSQASTYPLMVALAVQDVLPDPRIAWDDGEGLTPQVCATVSVRIIHRTKPGALVAWPS